MNSRRLLTVTGVLVGAIVLVLFWRWPRDSEVLPTSNQQTPPPSHPAETTLLTPGLKLPAFPADSRLQVQLLYKLARATKLYNFDPTIVYDQTNERPRMIDLGTPTHGASIMAGRIENVHSYYDGSDVRRKPEAAKEWYQCAGKWSKSEAIKETLRILEQLGETDALNQISEGRQDCEAVEMKVFKPDGQQIKVTPFYKVELHNRDGRTIAEAEYRMGADGPAGLTYWHCWP